MNPELYAALRLVAVVLTLSAYLCLLYLAIVGSVHLTCNPVAACFVRVCGFGLLVQGAYSFTQGIEESGL